MTLPSLLLLAAPDDGAVRSLVDSLAGQWAVTVCVPRALEQFMGAEEAVAELRRQAAESDAVLYLSSDGAQALAGVEGLVEVYGPSELSLCRLGPEEQADAEAWEIVWRRERDLARRARLLLTGSEELALKARLLYGVPESRMRRLETGGLGALLEEARTASPVGWEAPPRFTLALNDYLVGGVMSGGAVRVRQGLDALGEETLLLSCGVRGAAEMVGPRLLQLSVPKGPGQKAMEADFRALAGSGQEDVMTALHAPANAVLLAVAADLAQRARVAVFEHCYMAPLLDAMLAAAPALPVVYDAHNVERLLKRELLASHPARDLLCPFVDEVERRLVQAAGLVLCCSEADAAAFRPDARNVVLMPHGIVPAAVRDASEEGAQWRVGFLGSSHPPNVVAAQFILEHIAPRFPEVEFDIVGSVCGKLENVPGNVSLHGMLPENTKDEVLGRWHVALNPVEGGSGASLKLADYLAHGLPTLNTPHAARGFDDVARGAGVVVALDEFPAALRQLLHEPGVAARLRRAAREAGEAQSWPRMAEAARGAIDALVADYRPVERPVLTVHSGEAARVGRLLPGFRRVDMMADSPTLPGWVDRVVVVAQWAAAPWDGPVARARVALRTREEELGAILTGRLAYGARGTTEGTWAPFGLLLPAGSQRVTLRAATGARTRLRVRCGPLGCASPTLLFDEQVLGDVSLVLPLPEMRGQGAMLLEAALPEVSGAGLRLVAAEIAGERLPDEAPIISLSYDEGDSVQRSDTGPLPAVVRWELTAGRLERGVSVRRMVAGAAALAVERPFIFVVGDIAFEAAECAIVRFANGYATYVDADGVTRGQEMEAAHMLLLTEPPCVRLVMSRAGGALEDGLAGLAELLGVPIDRR